MLAHGGFQIQIEQTLKALQAAKVEAEYLRWWDADQRADIIHFFGRPSPVFIDYAHRKGIRYVMSDLLTGQAARSKAQLAIQKIVTASLNVTLPRMFKSAFRWESYRTADAVIALTAWEAKLMQRMFGAPASRVHVVPNGVDAAFFVAPAVERGPWLICTATITERKRVVELAEAAVRAETPLWIVGQPYSDSDAYYRRFQTLAAAHPDLIRYEGGISDRAVLAGIYRQARGFVLLSTMESLSLSALEAAACECPLLLSDLPWARVSFGEAASYCPIVDTLITANALRRFYDAVPTLPAPPKPKTWLEVAEQLNGIYERVLSTSS